MCWVELDLVTASGDLGGIVFTWPPPGPALALAYFLGVNQKMNDLYLAVSSIALLFK